MAILFDLDDTLLDDLAAKQHYMPKLYNHFKNIIKHPELTFYAKWKEAVPKYHKMYTDGIMTFEQQRKERVRDSFGNADISDSIVSDVVKTFDQYFKEGWKPFYNTLDILEYFKQEDLGIITNGSSKQQNEKIDILGIRHYFKCIIISDEVGVAKPDERIYLKTCSMLSCQPKDCVFIGDSWEIDIVGSNRCGMKSIWFNRYGKMIPEYLNNFHMITDLQELKQLNIK